MYRLILLAALVAVAGCTTPGKVEPSIQTVTAKVPVPVPCKALADLGPEPDYADTDAAIAGAANIGELANLYAVGRLQRIKRLGEYVAARMACVF